MTLWYDINAENTNLSCHTKSFAWHLDIGLCNIVQPISPKYIIKYSFYYSKKKLYYYSSTLHLAQYSSCHLEYFSPLPIYLISMENSRPSPIFTLKDFTDQQPTHNSSVSLYFPIFLLYFPVFIYFPIFFPILSYILSLSSAQRQRIILPFMSRKTETVTYL